MAQQLKITLGQASATGIKPDNEDCYGAYIPVDKPLQYKGITAVIADGMSGSDGGKEASQVSVHQFLDDYYSCPDSWTVKKAAVHIISALNTWLYSQGQKKYASAKGLVTTFSALILKSQTAHLLHIGDSRVYRWRKSEPLQQLTRDHRVWLSQDRDYLSRALGIDPHLDLDYRFMPLELGDVFLMTTDGVHDFIDTPQLEKLLHQYGEDLQSACEAILTFAAQAGSDDNLTCQLLRIESLARASRAEHFDKLTHLPFPPDLTAGQVMDSYKILRELKSSSRSQIYLAVDTQPDSPQYQQQLVLKTPSINFQDDMGYIDLFLHEEWVGRRLKSPHIIKTYAPSRQRQFLYTVLEYVHGQTLQQWMIDNPRPSLQQLRNSIEQISRGLRTMHRMEMIHQDLKPDNILIDKNNTLRLIDFGSTKIAGLAEIQTLIKHQGILGTTNYTAPEYFQHKPGSNRSDIFSLGVIAYEMLTGCLPYGEIDPHQVAHKRYIYRSAQQYNPSVPDWIDEALAKAVEVDPQRRYGLLSEFVMALSKPNPTQSLYKRQPWIERNPLQFWQTLNLIQFILLLILLYQLFGKVS